jgi:hypothetical protein
VHSDVSSDGRPRHDRWPARQTRSGKSERRTATAKLSAVSISIRSRGRPSRLLFRRVWSVSEGSFPPKKSPGRPSTRQSPAEQPSDTPLGALAPRLRLENIQITSTFHTCRKRDPFSHTPPPENLGHPRISETVRPRAKIMFSSIPLGRTSVRLHRRVDWPSFISLANITSGRVLHFCTKWQL